MRKKKKPMPSITNKTFRLPHIYATGYLKTFNSGANAPILATGINMDTHKKEVNSSTNLKSSCHENFSIPGIALPARQG
jgi:hypothetical protein